jgi:hypothetical protein
MYTYNSNSYELADIPIQNISHLSPSVHAATVEFM